MSFWTVVPSRWPDPALSEQDRLDALNALRRINALSGTAATLTTAILIVLLALVAIGIQQVIAAPPAATTPSTTTVAAVDPAPIFPPPPRLAISVDELAAAKAAPNFAAVRDAAARAADALINKPVPLPEGYGEWIFYYACPSDGTSLHALDLDDHQCPQCKKIYNDARTVAAHRCQMHARCENAAQTLAWAYAYTGDDKYAAGVQRILLKFADDYRTYPDRLDRWGHTGFFAPLGGRRYVQSLDEAVGAVRLTKAYDLTRLSNVWSDVQRKHVEEDFFRATAVSLLRFNQAINNHQTWYNAGLVCIASVLNDAAMVERVLTMTGGVKYQLEKSIGRDGLWYEGSMAYHNYALQPMVEIADATRRMGLSVYADPKLKLLITGPLHAAYPDGSFPVINDSDPGSVAMFDWAFEWAWKTYHEPFFAQAASRGNLQKLQVKLGPDAKVEWPLKLKSEVLSDGGLAILRQGEGPAAACVVMDFGPHGGGHGHYDKLNITLFATGREWLLDPGRLTYSHKEYKTWVKETAAHNTVSLGSRSQVETTGKLLWLKEGNGWSACAAESDGAYPRAMLRRYLLLTDKMMVDVFEVNAGTPTQMDWFAHATAEGVAPVPTSAETKYLSQPAVPGNDAGYRHLTEGKKWGIVGDTAWDFTFGGKVLRLFLAGQEGEQFITVNGIGYTVNQKTPTLLRRRNTAATQFVTVYDLGGKGDYVTGVAATGKETLINIKTTDGAWKIEFSSAGVTCELKK